METITSVQNERVKRIVKLQRKASARRAEGLTVIEGAREVQRAIENGWHPTELWACGDNFQCLENVDAVSSPRFQCSENVFEKITYRDNPDGVLAVGPLVGKKLSELDLPENPLILC